MEEFDTGNRLRALRLARRLSQRQLAEAAGVPHGQISMIETNRSSPSVASLRKILGGLGLGMAEFFEPDSPARTSPFFRADDLSDLTSRLYPSGDTMLAHDAHEGGIVVSGEIDVTVGTESRTLRAGDAYLFDSRAPHRFRNLSDAPAIVISACTPPYL